MQQIGQYEILGEIARGGMGVVYKARKLGLERVVALKVILGGSASPLLRRRFEREAKALGRIRHPAVVAVHDFDHNERDEPYLVMEWVEGESLQQRLNRSGPLTPGDAVELLSQLCEAVAACHAAGVVHRDLKPDNVLVTPAGLLKLIDFGIVRDVDASLSRTQLTARGKFLGSPGFWAPEQASGELERIGERTDVYGLGATLFALLTGRPPHEGTTLVEILASVRGEAPAPSSLISSVPAWLDAVTRKALASDPAQRFASPTALAQALTEGQSRQPTATRASRLGALGLVLGGALVAGAIGLASRGEPDSPLQAEDSSPSLAQSDPAALRRALSEARRHAQLDSVAAWIEAVSKVRGLAGDGQQAEVLESVLEQGRSLLAEAVRVARRPTRLNEDLVGALSSLASLRGVEPLGAEARWELADYLRRRGHCQRALESAEPILEHERFGARARYLRARMLEKLGGFYQAWDALSEAWQRDRDGVVGLTALAHRELNVDDPAEAIRLLDQALALDPDYAPARSLRADAQHRLGQSSNQTPLATQDRTDDPQLLLVESRVRDDPALLDAALDLTDQRDPDALWERGRRMLREDTPEKLTALGRRLTEVRPDARGFLLIALAEAVRENQDGFGAALRKAVAVDTRGFGEAVEALELAPVFAERCRLSSGLPQIEAWLQPTPVPPSPVGVDRLERLVASVAEPARGALRLALTQASVGLLSWGEIEDHAVQAREAAPRDPTLALILARLFTGRDQTRLALEQIKRARQLSLPKAELDLLEAEVLLRSGQETRARALFETLTDTPGVTGLCAQAELHVLREEFEPAAVAAEAALRLDPELASARFLAARALRGTDLPRAQEHARLAVEMFGSLDTRAICARASADGARYASTQGLMTLMQIPSEWVAFRRAKRYLKAATWLSGGAYAVLITARHLLQVLADERTVEASAFGGRNMVMMLHASFQPVIPLAELALLREPQRAEAHQLAGVFATTAAQRDRHWEEATRLDPDLPIREVYQGASRTRLKVVELLRNSQPRRRGGGD